MDLNAVQTLKVQSAQRRQQSSAMAQASQYAHAAAQYAMPYMTAQQQVKATAGSLALGGDSHADLDRFHSRCTAHRLLTTRRTMRPPFLRCPHSLDIHTCGEMEETQPTAAATTAAATTGVHDCSGVHAGSADLRGQPELPADQGGRPTDLRVPGADREGGDARGTWGTESLPWLRLRSLQVLLARLGMPPPAHPFSSASRRMCTLTVPCSTFFPAIRDASSRRSQCSMELRWQDGR
eukprot:scaffold359_cov351-Pinguiococcus_pyrenoidosus.AAC.4